MRAAEPRDADDVRAVYAPYIEESLASFEEMVPDVAEIARRMLAEPRLPWLVACEADRVVGYAYASHHRARHAYRWSVDFSVYLDASAHRRGIGRLLYERLMQEVRTLGYVTAYAGIALPNDASVGLHEALGFVPVGVFRSVGYKHGAWRDVGWWQLPLTEPPSNPEEPRAWTPAG